MNRRAFLAAAAAAPAALAQSNPPKRIAAILTEYRPGSHADVTVGKYLEGWLQDGKSPGPRSKIVSMYTEQVPDNDMSRPMAAKYGIPLYRTIHEALTLGGDDLAVDGVLLIGEHGDYPMNDKDQKLYPRFKMFLEITDTYRRTGHTAPIFNDKHLSYSFIKAKRMVEISEQMGFPMMAGSSVPVAHRRPPIDFPGERGDQGGRNQL
ncbi:MAG: twin-arginine translocation signal domain-containing protein [Bryobacterales bacterium]